MSDRRRYTAVLITACLAVFFPLVLIVVGPAAATTFPVNLNYTNLLGLPEGSTIFGTVNDTSGNLVWTLNSFTNGGVTYTALGVDGVCWDNTTSGSMSCNGFGKFVNGTAINGAFINPETTPDLSDTNGGFSAHVKWNSTGPGGAASCTGFIGSFPGSSGQFSTSGDTANDCLASVPEPGTASLMAMGLPGLVGLVGVSRRRSRRQS